MRSSSSAGACRRLSGSAASRLPASISFCSRGRWPSASGKVAMALSVRINQRSGCGSASAGTWAMALALKPTISSAGHSPSTRGSSVNRLLDAKRMRSRLKRCKSGDSSDNALPDTSSSSSVSAWSNTARGNTVRPWPFRRSSRMAGFRLARQGASVRGERVRHRRRWRFHRHINLRKAKSATRLAGRAAAPVARRTKAGAGGRPIHPAQT